MANEFNLLQVRRYNYFIYSSDELTNGTPLMVASIVCMVNYGGAWSEWRRKRKGKI